MASAEQLRMSQNCRGRRKEADIRTVPHQNPPLGDYKVSSFCRRALRIPEIRGAGEREGGGGGREGKTKIEHRTVSSLFNGDWLDEDVGCGGPHVPLVG